MGDIFGTGEPIKVGSQVVVEGHGMGTVTSVGCPVFKNSAGPAFHVRIEGDSEEICFPADIVRLYADVYAEVNADGLTEAETIATAEIEISAAQYRAVHDRLEDFVVYLEATGYIAPQALVGTDKLDFTNADHGGQLFELVETYLDGVDDAEYSGAVLDKILKPDLND